MHQGFHGISFLPWVKPGTGLALGETETDLALGETETDLASGKNGTGLALGEIGTCLASGKIGTCLAFGETGTGLALGEIWTRLAGRKMKDQKGYKSAGITQRQKRDKSAAIGLIGPCSPRLVS